MYYVLCIIQNMYLHVCVCLHLCIKLDIAYVWVASQSDLEIKRVALGSG